MAESYLIKPQLFRKMKRIIILILISFFVKDACAHKPSSIDSIKKNLEVDFRFNYAFILHHHYEMSGYRKHFPMFELSLQKQTYGRQSWQKFYNYPTIGVTAFYSNIGNQEVIGDAYAIYPFISFPFNKSKVNTFGLRLGAGLGYLTEKFHHEKNPYNTYISAYFNAAISLSLEYKQQINNHLKMSIFAGLTHFSNGCTTQPNRGINIFNAGLSASYLIDHQTSYKEIANLKTDIKEEKRQINRQIFRTFAPEFYLGLSYGVKRVEYKQRDHFSVYNLEFYAMERVTNLSKFGIGLDLVYDATDVIVLGKHENNLNKYTFAQLLKPGVGLAYELILGEMSFLFNVGYHPWGRDMSYGRIYNKLAVKGNIGKHLYGKFTLNTHLGVADFIGFGFGVRL